MQSPGSPTITADPFNLARFLKAQERDHAQALSELKAGRKQTHWIWYVLPQLRGLGTSRMSEIFGLSGLAEAQAYLAHPLLGPRLVECVEAISAHRSRSAEEILGSVDAMKYQSCLTLFGEAGDVEGGSVFETALQWHFAGVRDARTLRLATGRGGVSGA